MGYLNSDEFNELRRECWDNSVAWFPEVHARGFEHELIHMALGLAGESGEAVDVIKKWHRMLEPLNMADLGAELADTLIYMMHICTLLRIDLLGEVRGKIEINRERFGRE